MSWKLGTLAIAGLVLSAASAAPGGQRAAWNDAPTWDQAPIAAADDANPLAAKGKSDKELIEKQKTCPVTDQSLGSMGKPIKVHVKGRTVFLCCAGCKKKLMADPEKYLKKLDKK